MKKILPACLFLSLILSASPAIGADEKPAFFPADLHVDASKDRVFSLGDDSGTLFSGLGIWPTNICTSTKDPVCDFKNAKWGSGTPGIMASPMLNPCNAGEENDCIESVEIKRTNTGFKKLVFEKFMPRRWDSDLDGKEFPADYSMNLPRGGAASIWNEIIDGKPSEVKYLVSYQYSMFYNPETKKFQLQNVRLGIRPFKEIAETRWSSLWYTDGASGIQYDFSPDVEMRGTIHMSKEAAGWFKARLTDPEISISNLNERNTKVIVSGSPVTVPAFAFVREIGKMSSEELKHTNALKGVIFEEPGSREIFDYIELARKTVNDIAAYSNTYWGLNSTPWDNSNPCLQDSSRVLGIVSTNAMGYEGASPKFEDGFLNYKVTGLHYAADGKTPNLGTYDLLLRSDAARCLYGFSNAPISAVVSISGSDNAKNVATTVVTEKDGWLKLKAAGFTFSEKKIKVRLNQEAPVKVNPAVNAPAKSTITCVKRKTTKKITAIKPTCPVGYKRK
ncbi:MAG: hypothetical protein ACKOXI_01595 [Candidatus Planktophila sp.]